MHREIVLFRLVLVISAVSFLLCSLGAVHSHFQAESWQQEAQESLKAMKEAKYTQDWWMQSFDTSVEAGGMYSKRSALLLRLACIVPAISIFLFYAGRWILLGRLRPLWPLKREI